MACLHVQRTCGAVGCTHQQSCWPALQQLYKLRKRLGCGGLKGSHLKTEMETLGFQKDSPYVKWLYSCLPSDAVSVSNYKNTSFSFISLKRLHFK